MTDEMRQIPPVPNRLLPTHCLVPVLLALLCFGSRMHSTAPLPPREGGGPVQALQATGAMIRTVTTPTPSRAEGNLPSPSISEVSVLTLPEGLPVGSRAYQESSLPVILVKNILAATQSCAERQATYL